jgi:hypothetical protein
MICQLPSDAFTCPVHRARLSPASCAGRYLRAERLTRRRRADEASVYVQLVSCVGCQVGVGHAAATTPAT